MNDRTLLKEIHENFQASYDEIDQIHKEAAIDMRFVSGDSWDPAERRAREDAKRPCLVFDEIGQFQNSVINAFRANKRGVKFEPEEDSDARKAQLYADKMREIEYRSGAGIIYSGAFQDAVQRGYGWCRWTMKFSGERTLDKELWIEPVMNPDSVYPDPASVWPDSRDLNFLVAVEERRKSQLLKEFPGAAKQDFVVAFKGASASKRLWSRGADMIQLGEYWYYETQIETLLMLHTAEGVKGVYESELKPKDLAYWRAKTSEGVRLLGERQVEVRKVKRCLTNGLEILERSEWPGKYIPFASCFGMVIYVDEGGTTKRRLLSLTRKMRNPQQALNYVATGEMEAISDVPRANYIGYKGQFKGHEADWADANTDPRPYVEFNGTTEESAQFQQVLPPPIRNSWDPPIQNMEFAKESIRRSVQAAGGSTFLPTQAQRRNEKSGVALQEIQQNAEKGTFHFEDHGVQMIERMGVIGEDLFDKVYDSTREMTFRDEKGSAYRKKLNDPADPKSVDLRGSHAVTVSTGPSADSKRDAVKDLLVQFAGDERMFPLVAGPLLKAMNLGDPSVDQLIERVEAMLPPQVQQAEAAKGQKDGQPENPAALKAENQQLKMQLQQAGQMVQQAEQALQTDQAKQQAMLVKAKADAQTKMQIANIDAHVKLQIAQSNAMVAFETAKLEADAAGQALSAEQVEAARQRVFDGLQAAADRLHDFQIAEIEHEHELEKAKIAHDQALEQGVEAAKGQIAVNAAKPAPAKAKK